MRRDTVIVGIVMLVVGIGIGYGIAIARLFIETRDAMHEIASDVAAANSEVKVRVLAKQYSWHFHYPGEDGVFGATATNAITEDNHIGLDMSDPTAADDFVSSELVLPCDTTVALIITSADVIHAIGHLEGDFEEDAIPGMDITEAVTTPGSPRDGRLKCVQLCGAGHAAHNAPYRFVDQADYNNWSAERSATARQAKAESGRNGV